ncbi:MAG: hypothetical protein QW209_06525 [Nitrososphaerota archaeon]
MEAYKWLAIIMFVLAGIVTVACGVFFDLMKMPLTYNTGGLILALVIWLLAIGLMAFGAWKFGASLRAKLAWFKHWKNAAAFVLILVGLLLIFAAVKFPFIYSYTIQVPGKAYALDKVYTLVPVSEHGTFYVMKDANLITWEYYEVVAYHQIWIQTPLFLAGLALIIVGLVIGWWSIYSGNIAYEKLLSEKKD